MRAFARLSGAPSWGWWMEQGATTLWEQWNGADSRIHVMFGDVSAWFYKALAGIQPDLQSPGFKHFYVTPHVVGDLTSARGEYRSIRGRIVSDWQVANGEFQLHLSVPANSSATVSLPIAGEVLETGKPIAQSREVKFLRSEAGRSLFEVGSGDYRFSGTLVK